jgi:hypothetical protein
MEKPKKQQAQGGDNQRIAEGTERNSVAGAYAGD